MWAYSSTYIFPNLGMQFSGLKKGKRKRKEEYFDRGVSFNSAFPARVSPLSFFPLLPLPSAPPTPG